MIDTAEFDFYAALHESSNQNATTAYTCRQPLENIPTFQVRVRIAQDDTLSENKAPLIHAFFSIDMVLSLLRS